MLRNANNSQCISHKLPVHEWYKYLRLKVIPRVLHICNLGQKLLQKNLYTAYKSVTITFETNYLQDCFKFP